MNTLQNLIDNGIEINTAIRMLSPICIPPHKKAPAPIMQWFPICVTPARLPLRIEPTVTFLNNTQSITYDCLWVDCNAAGMR